MNAQPIQDVNDRKPWSEMDLFDLRNSLAYGRIRGHTKAALRHGVTRQELMEAIWVAAEMRAGAAYAIPPSR
jgi:alkylhydroperoxidase/carboxymuconolactone decarboxylase family protein YurZ